MSEIYLSQFLLSTAMDVEEECENPVEYSEEEYEVGEIIDSIDNDILIEYIGPSIKEEIQTYNCKSLAMCGFLS